MTPTSSDGRVVSSGAAAHPPSVLLFEVNGLLIDEIWSTFAGRLAQEAGGIDAREVHRAIERHRGAFERSGADLGAFARSVTLDLDLRVPAARFGALLLEDSVVPHPENAALLRGLRESRHLRMAAFSNLPAPVYGRADAHLEIGRWVDGELLASREAIAKPNAQVYVQAIEAARVPSGEILLLDITEESVRTARVWGMNAVRVESPAHLPAALGAWFPNPGGSGPGTGPTA